MSVYLKDSSFLPDVIEIIVGESVFFHNEDSASYSIICRGNQTFPSLEIKRLGTVHHQFHLPGRYELSDKKDLSMKCLVEVRERERENEPKQNFQYFPLTGKPSKATAITAQQQDKVKPPKKLFTETITFEYDEDDEELDNIRNQRQLYKSSLPPVDRLKTFSTVTVVPPEVAISKSKDPVLRSSNMELLLDAIEITSGKQAQVYKVHILDFDFDIHELNVLVGDSLLFSLSPNTPMYAEHVIFGTSDIKALCFESDLLQVRI